MLEGLKDLHKSIGITIRIIITSVLYAIRTSLRDLHEGLTSPETKNVKPAG